MARTDEWEELEVDLLSAQEADKKLAQVENEIDWTLAKLAALRVTIEGVQEEYRSYLSDLRFFKDVQRDLTDRIAWEMVVELGSGMPWDESAVG